MTVIEQIKAEIERLKVDYLNRSYTFVPTAMQQLLDFIDTLESEKPMNQEGLDEEIKRYIDEYYKEDCIVLIAHVARHFAKWGAEHTPLPEDTVLFNKGVEEGKRLMMEELSDHIAAAYQLGLAANNPNIELKAELIHTTDTAQVDGKELLYVSDKSYKIGWRDCRERIVSLIESRLSEIIGDAQPKPILRMELKELINKIKI